MFFAKGSTSWIFSSLFISLFFIILTYFTTGQIRHITIIFLAIFLLIFCMFLLFFRDPERTIGSGVVAVADGKIREVTHQHDHDVGDCIKISTFMNIHNVHVNRMPLDGTIENITHYTGKHLPAFQKESERNERVIILISTHLGNIKIIQIAGTIARRIVPYIKKGDGVKKGGKIGLIRLGSRVDVYLPTKKIKSLSIQVNSTVHAGEDTIAELND